MPQYELNLNDYVRIIYKRKNLIFLSVVVVTLLSFIFSTKSAPYYEARSTVKIEQRQTVAGMLTDWVSFNPANLMESHSRLIRGFPVMRKVALRLGMTNEQSSFPDVDKAVASLQDSVTTRNIGNTNIIEIIVSSADPKKAMDIANAVAGVYIEENMLEKNQQAITTRSFIEDQLNVLEKRLREGEEKLRQFGDEVKDIRLSGPIEQKLTDLQVELVELQQKYTDKHPAVMRVRDQIQDLEAQLKGFSGKDLEYAKISREVEVNKKLYAMLKEKLEESRITEAQKVGDVSLVDPAALPTTATSQGKGSAVLLGVLLGAVLGLILAFVGESMDTSLASIEDVEAVTKLSVLGVIPSIKQKHREETKKSNIQKLLELFLPVKIISEDEHYVRLVSHIDTKSIAAEAFRTIRTNLKISPERKTILITSTGPQEGKTAILINLGTVIAQTGQKVLLVSTDLRRPAIEKTFGVKREPGFSEVVMKKAKLDDALCNISDIILSSNKLEAVMHSPGLENIWILPSGHNPANPAELLELKETVALITELKKRFDVILFDSPPILPVTDAVLLSRFMDGAVVIYEVGKIARSALLRAKAQLESSGGKLLGIVLNHVKTAEAYAGYPYYYYSYKKYYGHVSGNAEKKS